MSALWLFAPVLIGAVASEFDQRFKTDAAFYGMASLIIISGAWVRPWL